MNDWRFHEPSWAPYEVQVFNHKCFKIEKAAVSGSYTENAVAEAHPPPISNVPERSSLVGTVIIHPYRCVD